MIEFLHAYRLLFFGLIAGSFLTIVILFFTLGKQVVTGKNALQKLYNKERADRWDIYEKLLRVMRILSKLRRRYVALLKDFQLMREANQTKYNEGYEDGLKDKSYGIGKDLIKGHTPLRIQPVGTQSPNFQKIVKKNTSPTISVEAERKYTRTILNY